MPASTSKSKKVLIVGIATVLIVVAGFLISPQLIPVKEKPQIVLIKGFNTISNGSIGFSFSPVAVNFESKPARFAVRNNGTADLIIDSISVVSGDTSQFTVNFADAGQIIPPGNFTTFEITFTPKSIGTKTAVVSIQGNAYANASFVFVVNGTAIAAPAPESIAALPENGSVTLSWTAVKGATSYNIYWSERANVSKETGTKIEGGSPYYVHGNLVNGRTYYYVVTAVTSYGEGTESNVVSARPGRTFYVDTLNGNNSNNGLTPENAWKAIEKINSMSFTEGDYIYFKRGCIWNETKLEVPSSGVQYAPITIGAYGMGEKPIITVHYSADTSILVAGKEFVTIQNLDVRGGNQASLSVYGSDHVVIENCTIGINSKSIGIWVSKKYWAPIKNSSDYGIIRNCFVYSGYEPGGVYPEDGIHLRSSANYWEIYNNVIKDWGHSAISLWQNEENTTVSHNKIYRNLITTEKSPYCRGYDIKGMDGGCQYNEFYFNIIRNTTVRSQIGGDHNLVYYNIIDTVRNSEMKDYRTAQGILITRGYVNSDYVAHHNKIYNNIIYNCDESGIRIRSIEDNWSIHDNEIKNNILMNCGVNSKDGLNYIGLYISG